jgi:MFS family permease
VIARLPGVQLAALSMLIGQAIMVLVMTVTSLHMNHNHHTFADISLVIMAHTLGMYGLSFVTGTIADRFGRPAVVSIGLDFDCWMSGCAVVGRRVAVGYRVVFGGLRVEHVLHRWFVVAAQIIWHPTNGVATKGQWS